MIDVSRRTLWIVLAAALTLLAFALSRAGIEIRLTANPVLGFALVAALSLPLWLKPSTARQARLTSALELAALFSLVSTMGAIASYAVAAGSTGYADAVLAGADHALGFDWIAMYRAVAARPWLSVLAQGAYLSIFVTPIAVMFGLGLAGRAGRARQFLAAFGLALVVTLTIFHFFPARSALAYHLGTEVAYLPAAGFKHIAVIEAARAGMLAPIDPTDLAGIITFPSFHVCAALLFVWAAWPVRRLRWPIAALNAAMIAATPVEGTHYLIDVIGGSVVALLAIGALHLPIIVTRAQPRLAAA